MARNGVAHEGGSSVSAKIVPNGEGQHISAHPAVPPVVAPDGTHTTSLSVLAGASTHHEVVGKLPGSSGSQSPPEHAQLPSKVCVTYTPAASVHLITTVTGLTVPGAHVTVVAVPMLGDTDAGPVSTVHR